MTYSNWTTADTYEFGKIEQINSGVAGAFTTDGLVKLKYSLIEAYLDRGTFVSNRLNIRDIMLLKDGDGQYIWRPGLTEGAPSTLLGLPFRMATTIAVTAGAALAIALAEWKQAYLVLDRLGITVQRDPFTASPLIKFNTRKRVGGDVVNYLAIKIGVLSA